MATAGVDQLEVVDVEDQQRVLRRWRIGRNHHAVKMGLQLEGVFVQIGLVPNSEWLKGTLELSRHGEIVVDARGQTSLAGVFAAGDVTTVPFKQIIIATGDGARCVRSPDAQLGTRAGGCLTVQTAGVKSESARRLTRQPSSV